MTAQASHAWRILARIEAGGAVSQRSLARELGIALGLTNLLLRRLVHKGLVRLVRIKSNRVQYLITPAGIAEKVRLSRSYFASSVRFYVATRDRIRDCLAVLSAEWTIGAPDRVDCGPCERRIVFYGAGEVAEIGFVCLQDSDLTLVGVVDAHRTKVFFGFPVHRPEQLEGATIAGEPFGRLLVMSFDESDEVGAVIAARRVPPDLVVWL